VCKSKGATRHHHHHPALSLSLLISLSNRDVCALGRADIETLSLSLLQRNGRTRTKKKAPPPWRSTTQTSRKARKVRRTLFFDRRSNKRARRSIGFDLFSLFVLSFSRHISLTTQCAMLSTDLLTGSLTYENKFSLDAKPIEGGVRVVVVIVAFETAILFLFRPTNFARTRRKKEIENHPSFPKEEEEEALE
jgi:hypothetical protein